jgi:hypothetical protein
MEDSNGPLEDKHFQSNFPSQNSGNLFFLRAHSKVEKRKRKMILDELDTQHKNITVNSSFFLSLDSYFFVTFILTHHVRKIFIRNAIAEKLHPYNCS